MKQFKVRAYAHKTKPWKVYKFNADGHDWTTQEIEELDERLIFIFGPSMNEEDIAKVKDKWSHKLLGVMNER